MFAVWVGGVCEVAAGVCMCVQQAFERILVQFGVGTESSFTG
jgi:hypothetical protein